VKLELTLDELLDLLSWSRLEAPPRAKRDKLEETSPPGGNGIPRGKCPFCGKTFKGLGGVAVHIARQKREGHGHEPIDK